MDKATHLTEDDLILFMDREMDPQATSIAEQHLLVCVDCGKRLQGLQNGSAAYVQYRKQILEPALRVPVSGWAPIEDRPVPRSHLGWGTLWGAAAALACGLLLAWLYLGPPSQPSAQGLLRRASATQAPARGTLLWTSGKYRFARPAVLEAGTSEVRFQHVQALFVKANYSWENPLSARSFAMWRQQLPEKRDYVTSVTAEGGRHFYRVRTRTEAGILRSAALTLQADNYHPTRASFEFQGEDSMELSEQTELPKNGPQEVKTVPAIHPMVTETAAGPEDELRVFAALDAIGADAEEPIDVKLDAGHHSVLVTGMGMPAARRKQIEASLGNLPGTVVRFSAGQPLQMDTELITKPDTHADDSGVAFRQKLQDGAGGVRQLQTITDGALETSNALFAQSHSLLVLSQEFPSLVEATLSATSATTLLALRQRHVGAMEYALRRLKDDLRPLLAEDAFPDSNSEISKLSSWQSGGEALFEATRNLDRLVSRLLAGSYNEQAGEDMLKQLPGDVSRTEMLVRAQSVANNR